MLDKYNFRESETKWQKFWQENNVYKFDINSKQPIFAIDTPPPTVSGHIHIGHIFSYSQAEFMARFKRMTGYNVFYPFGFDDNGLPTERLVEKEKKIKAHEMSREEFGNLCREVAQKYEQEFKEMFIKAGNSADFNLLYSTASPSVQKASQKSFIELAKNKLAYYAEKPAIWCPECRISIAQAELESKDIPSFFNYLHFKLVDNTGCLEIATTRPELLSACVCVFVHPDDKRYIDFVGKKVIVPFYHFEVPVLTDDKVSLEKGTGAVMCCTFGDETDLFWQEKHSLPIKTAIDDGGRMTQLAGEFAGLKIKVARESIIEKLKQSKELYKQENIIHAVSTHERCGTPMEINIKKQWFIDLMSHKKEFLELGNKINWFPSFMKSRYLNWVENIDRDWCISRQRYFGVPIPVWYCKNCGEIIFAEEEQLPCNPLTTQPLHACHKCGGKDFEPEKDIFDTWQTSSITPLINAKWIDGESNELMKKIYPMSLRPNAHDIIRTWDFYTIVKSFYHTNSLPWKNVMISGFVMADKDNKISKSKNNAKFNSSDLINEKSADVTRYWASTGSLGRDIIFSDEEMKNGAKLVNKIWNASKFVLSFLQNYQPKEIELTLIDQWIIAKFNNMQKNFINYFERYEIGLAIGELEKFFWNFCDNYIEIAKRRLYNPDVYGEDATESAKFSSFMVLKEMLKMFAIYLPHITEEIYKDFYENYEHEISIHKTLLKQISCHFDKKLSLEEIIKLGDDACEIVTSVRRFKSENNLSLKEEISSINISGFSQSINLLEQDIKAVCTVKNICYDNKNKEKQIIINK